MSAVIEATEPVRWPLRALLGGLLALAIAAAASWFAPWWPSAGLGQPVAVLPTAAAGDTFAVVYSGDSGWSPMSRGLARGLVEGGVPVVGYNSLAYFWTARTPDGAAADLAVTLRRYMALWGKRRVVLVGFSFGADALSPIVARLPLDLRGRVRLVALVGLNRSGALQFHPGSWLNLDSSSGYPNAPAVAALRGEPMVCIYGRDDDSSLCPHLSPDLIRPIALPGGHHFDGRSGVVGRAILAALRDDTR